MRPLRLRLLCAGLAVLAGACGDRDDAVPARDARPGAQESRTGPAPGARATQAPSPDAERHVAPGSAPTREGRYRVSLAPAEGEVPLGTLHAWIVRVETPDGAPVTPTRLAFDGGMPQHGHGLPTQPRVTRALGDGAFLVEGVRFHMHGDWRLVVELVGPAGPDVAVFHVDVAP